MKLVAAAIGALATLASVSAQYFSEGWSPGQPVPTPTDAPSPASFDPTAVPKQPEARKPIGSLLSSLSLENALSYGPVSDLLGNFGINITDRLQKANAALDIWDKRVPMVTDDNWRDLIVNEPMTEEEEKDRVWFLIVTGSSAQQSGLSAFADQQFDETFNRSVISGDLPNVRFGRVDYINVTALTTKWVVWGVPMLIVATDRGQTLRFWRATQLRLRSDSLYEWLKTESWRHTPPWKSAFAPGGKREFIMDWLAIGFTKTYSYVRWLPKWLAYVITGALGSMIINVLHAWDSRNKAKQAKKEAEKAAVAKKEAEARKATEGVSGTSTSVEKPTPSTKSRKKGGKK